MRIHLIHKPELTMRYNRNALMTIYTLCVCFLALITTNNAQVALEDKLSEYGSGFNDAGLKHYGVKIKEYAKDPERYHDVHEDLVPFMHQQVEARPEFEEPGGQMTSGDLMRFLDQFYIIKTPHGYILGRQNLEEETPEAPSYHHDHEPFSTNAALHSEYEEVPARNRRLPAESLTSESFPLQESSYPPSQPVERRNFQLRVRKSQPGMFQLRVRKSKPYPKRQFQLRVRKSENGDDREPMEEVKRGSFQLRVRKNDEQKRNFQLRVRKSNPFQLRVRKSVKSPSSFQLRVRRDVGS